MDFSNLEVRIKDEEIKEKPTEKPTEKKLTLNDFCDQDATSNFADYPEEVIDFIKKNKVMVSVNLSDALTFRSKGIAKFTLREIDTVVRSGQRGIDAFKRIMSCPELGLYIVESIPCQENSIWTLRRTYNRGLELIKKAKDKEEQNRILKKMQDIVRMIEQSGSCIFKCEVGSGFNKRLTYPEYMTEQKYLELTRRYKVLMHNG